jgi:biopolymer transport protein ExbB
MVFSMKKLAIALSLSMTLGAQGVLAQEKETDSQRQLRQEINALKRLKLKKLEQLEKKEAKRWEARYEENAQAKIWDEDKKALDARYNQLASQMTRKQDELQGARSRTEDLEILFDQVDRRAEQFSLAAKQMAEKRSEALENDLPLQVTKRTALLNQAQMAVADSNHEKRDTEKSILYSLDEMKLRLALGQNQTIETRNSINPAGSEVAVWHLQFGSMLIADVEKQGPFVQSLMKTGAIKGQLWAWRTDLSAQYAQALREMGSKVASGDQSALVPIDILQSKDKGRGFASVQSQSLSQLVSAWFKKGGLVMYPLMMCAFFAFALGLEKFFKFQSRGRTLDKTRHELMPLIRSGKWEDAIAFCEKRGTGLAKAVEVVVQNRHLSRETAEKSVSESLLTEVPNLEKRLGLISALGSSAPLLGLLGTVSGMIALFKVITDVGTNDARLLAGGISEALVTTQTGLIIAIPILLLHGFLSERLDNILASLNAVTMEALNIVWSGDEERRQKLLKGEKK